MDTEKGYTIFVVEDSDVYRSLLVHALEPGNGNEHGADYMVYSFPSGEKCLQHLHLRPDIVVLDYFLNGNGYIYNIDGLAVLRRIRKFSPSTDVIVVSCQENIDVMKRFLQAGIREYIKKEGLGQHRVKQAVQASISEKEKKKTQQRLMRYAAVVFVALSLTALIYWLARI